MPRCNCTTTIGLSKGGSVKLPCSQEATIDGLCFYHDKVLRGVCAPEHVQYHRVLKVESEGRVLWEK